MWQTLFSKFTFLLLLLALFLRRFEGGRAFIFVTISPVNFLTAGVTVVCIFADKLILTQKMIRSMVRRSRVKKLLILTTDKL
jgi:hypothetical protein